MIALFVVVALLSIFNQVQKLSIRPVFVRVRANNSRRIFK